MGIKLSCIQAVMQDSMLVQQVIMYAEFMGTTSRLLSLVMSGMWNGRNIHSNYCDVCLAEYNFS